MGLVSQLISFQHPRKKRRKIEREKEEEEEEEEEDLGGVKK